MQKDSIANTFIVAGGVCLVCSLLVSTAAVVLKPKQDANVLLDRKMNILLATGEFEKDELDEETVNQKFETQVDDRLIDLETGEDITDTMSPAEVDRYNGFKASKKEPKLDRKVDIAQIKRKEKIKHVYIFTNEDGEKIYIFPIRGYGLWSTLKGFIALKQDLRTIAGLTYYEHKETPGLGGEVDNPAWKAKWTPDMEANPPRFKYLTDETGQVRISVTSPEQDARYKVDSLSGATITSRGVENMIRFWMGEQGFGKFIERVQKENPSSPGENQSASQSGDDQNG